MSSSALVPFAQHVRLRGRGPFQLPRMKGILSIGEKSWPWPLLRFESEQGEEVWVPLAAEAVQSLKLYLEAWQRLPDNPFGQ